MMHAAIVTGVSRGLGAALAAALLERDFVVLGVGRGSHPRLTGERYRFVRFELGPRYTPKSPGQVSRERLPRAGDSPLP